MCVQCFITFKQIRVGIINNTNKGIFIQILKLNLIP